MTHYKNISGKSGVTDYEIKENHIMVMLRGVKYIYEVNIIGNIHFNQMKEFAIAGEGLATYIAKNRDVYNAGKKIS